MQIGNIHLYQLLIIVLSSIMIYQGVNKYLRGETGQSLYKVSIRVLVWGGMALVATFPDITNAVAEILGIKGNINAVILVGFLLVFLMVFKLLSAIERLERDISRLTRKDALMEINKKNEKTK